MTPNTPMPFGAFQGQKLKDVPDLYLAKLSKSGKCPDDLKEYINDNIQTEQRHEIMGRNETGHSEQSEIR